MESLRDKIARALKEVSDERLTDTEFEMFGDTPINDFYPEADAVLAVIDLDKIRAEAWDEGFDACEEDIFNHRENGWDAECIKATYNPYRPEGEEQ